MNENNVDNFYIRCPSNTSTNWESNTFTFQLSHAIQLDNPYEWECALHEIFLPKRFYNIYEPFTRNVMRLQRINIQKREDMLNHLEAAANIIFQINGGLTEKEQIYYETEGKRIQQLDGEFMPGSEMVFSLPPGYYTCSQLMENINYQLEVKTQRYISKIRNKLTPEELERELKAQIIRKLEYNKSKAKFYLTLAKGDIVHFENDVFNDLIGVHTADNEDFEHFLIPPEKTNVFLKDGMPKTIKNTHFMANQRTTIHFARTCDLDSQSRHVYVYADVIEPNRVGNAYVPLLRIVNLSQENSDDLSSFGVVHSEFRRPQYFPVGKKNTINEITVKLSSSTGELFPFKGGMSILDLHFRKKKLKK